MDVFTSSLETYLCCEDSLCMCHVSVPGSYFIRDDGMMFVFGFRRLSFTKNNEVRGVERDIKGNRKRSKQTTK